MQSCDLAAFLGLSCKSWYFDSTKLSSYSALWLKSRNFLGKLSLENEVASGVQHTASVPSQENLDVQSYVCQDTVVGYRSVELRLYHFAHEV